MDKSVELLRYVATLLPAAAYPVLLDNLRLAAGQVRFLPRVGLTLRRYGPVNLALGWAEGGATLVAGLELPANQLGLSAGVLARREDLWLSCQLDGRPDPEPVLPKRRLTWTEVAADVPFRC